MNYQEQEVMNGREGSVTASYSCSFPQTAQQLRLEAGLVRNDALKDLRPGGDRDGWNIRINWQRRFGSNEFSSQMGYSRLEDETGYSILLDNGAVRTVTSQYINVRYKYFLQNGWGATLNLSHQQQDSNLEPFRNRGTVAEVGLVLDF